MSPCALMGAARVTVPPGAPKTAVPFCQELGFTVPSHFDATRQLWMIDCAFPATFDERAKRWQLEDGAIRWDDVLIRWKRRGPMNAEFVETLQRGHKGLERLLNA